jgi:hypothetical protein
LQHEKQSTIKSFQKTKKPMKNLKIFLSGLILLFFCGLDAMAQQIHVKGNIITKGDNEPVIGASILEVGTTNR